MSEPDRETMEKARERLQSLLHQVQRNDLTPWDFSGMLVAMMEADAIHGLANEQRDEDEALRPDAWMIRADAERDDDGRPLYWSNGQGWVERDSADRFSFDERTTLTLPVGGKWEDVR